MRFSLWMFLINLLASRLKTLRWLIVFVQYDIHHTGYYDTLTV